MLSIELLPSLNITPPARPLTTIQRVQTDILPNTTRIYEENQELRTKVESLENALLKEQQLCQEMWKLKDEHFMFLKTDIKNLPALILSQLKE